MHTWRSENYFQELVYAFHHVSPRNQSQIRLVGKGLYQLSHLASPIFYIFQQDRVSLCSPGSPWELLYRPGWTCLWLPSDEITGMHHQACQKKMFCSIRWSVFSIFLYASTVWHYNPNCYTNTLVTARSFTEYVISLTSSKKRNWVIKCQLASPSTHLVWTEVLLNPGCLPMPFFKPWLCLSMPTHACCCSSNFKSGHQR